MQLGTDQLKSYFRLLLAESLINQVGARYGNDPLVASILPEVQALGQKLNELMDDFEGGRLSDIAHEEGDDVQKAVEAICLVIDGKDLP